MLERDFYFASWVISQGIGYEVRNKRLYLLTDRSTIRHLKVEYNKKYNSLFTQVRKIIEQIKADKFITNSMDI